MSVSNGMVTAVGQKTDTKIPETIGAVAGLAGTVIKASSLTEPGVNSPCMASAVLYAIEGGKPNKDMAIVFPVNR